MIKTSLLESFSYSPLEMMATGGYVVALANEGNREYLKDRWNVLFYERGNTDQAVNLLNELIHDTDLQNILYKNGIQCAQSREWDSLNKDIVKLYFGDRFEPNL